MRKRKIKKLIDEFIFYLIDQKQDSLRSLLYYENQGNIKRRDEAMHTFEFLDMIADDFKVRVWGKII